MDFMKLKSQKYRLDNHRVYENYGNEKDKMHIVMVMIRHLKS